jgi:hypothetical protein
MEIKRVPDDAQRFTAGGSFRDSSPDGAPPARISRVRHIKSVYSSPTPDESRDIETYINRAIIGPFPDNQIPSLPVQHTDLEQSNTGDVSAHPSEFVQTLPTDLPYGYSGETGNLAAFPLRISNITFSYASTP